jgi:hypothetical protein
MSLFSCLTNNEPTMKKGIAYLVFLALWLSFTASAENAGDDLMNRVRAFNPVQYKMALADLEKSFPDQFKTGAQTAVALQKMSERQDELLTRMKNKDKAAINEATELITLLDAQLLRNPLIDGKPLIAIKRHFGPKARAVMGGDLGLAPSNFQNNSEIRNPSTEWNNELINLTVKNGKQIQSTLYRPQKV